MHKLMRQISIQSQGFCLPSQIWDEREHILLKTTFANGVLASENNNRCKVWYKTHTIAQTNQSHLVHSNPMAWRNTVDERHPAVTS